MSSRTAKVTQRNLVLTDQKEIERVGETGGRGGGGEGGSEGGVIGRTLGTLHKTLQTGSYLLPEQLIPRKGIFCDAQVADGISFCLSDDKPVLWQFYPPKPLAF